MLIELFGENFGCFRDEFRLSMLATDIDPGSTRGIVEVKIDGDEEPLRLLRCAAIYGPNASGKSTVLRAAHALRRALLGSHRYQSDQLIPYYRPFIGGTSSKSPCRLGIKAVINGKVYDYEIRFNRKMFNYERLAQWDGDDPVVLIERIDQSVTGKWKDEESFQLLSKDFGPNKLLLPLADRLMPGLAQGIAPVLSRLLQVIDGKIDSWPFHDEGVVARRVAEDPSFAHWLLNQLKAADLGVIELHTDEVRSSSYEKRPIVDEADDFQYTARTEYALSLVHDFGENAANIDFNHESLGTHRLIDLAPLIFDLAHDALPQAVFADELDASLHPIILRGLVDSVNRNSEGKERGQLIFTTHETSLLDDEAKNAPLRRDQVYLTEKGSDGAARLYSIAEFKERNNLNLRKRYLEGRYGAIPVLGTFPE